jgi:hypothetical protein
MASVLVPRTPYVLTPSKAPRARHGTECLLPRRCDDGSASAITSGFAHELVPPAEASDDALMLRPVCDALSLIGDVPQILTGRARRLSARLQSLQCSDSCWLVARSWGSGRALPSAFNSIQSRGALVQTRASTSADRAAGSGLAVGAIARRGRATRVAAE